MDEARRKIRKRSKACRGGLWENDELVSINGKSCAGLSHASAMQIIDSSNGILNIVVKRASSGDLSGVGFLRSPSPRQLQVVSPGSPLSQASQLHSPELAGPPVAAEPELQSRRQQHLENLTSPPDSEAYYAETDSDADNIAQEKHRRARKKSPRSPPGGPNNKVDEPQDEVSLSNLSGYDSTPEATAQAGEHGENFSGVTKREIVCQPGSRTHTPLSESDALLQPPLPEDREPSPEAMLLPHATKTIRAERHLIPMIGPVEHPVDEDLTTSYAEKAKQAKLHRSESMQEKNVKEAKTKCRTIASLLTDAPNPHSKGVLMFKKRRQRAKKYTLVSFGSVDEDRCYDEEDGVFPTSESEFDEEGFSDARSLTNHSDWDNTYLDIEKPKESPAHEQAQTQQGLSEASGRGAQLFEQQRQKAGKHIVEKVPPSPHEPEEQSSASTILQTCRVVRNEAPIPQKAEKAPLSIHLEAVQVSSQLPSPSPAQLQSPSGIFGGGGAQISPSTTGIFNRSARPFTPGFSGQRPMTSSVVFRPSVPRKSSERTAVPPFSPAFPETTVLPPTPLAMQPSSPASTSVSLYIPTAPSSVQLAGAGNPAEGKPPSNTARTSTASIYLSAPSKPAADAVATTSLPFPPSQAQEAASSTLYISPVPQQPLSQPYSQPFTVVAPAIPRPASEPFASREQRIAVPAPRTGILQEARRRSSKKPMFKSVEEKKKNSPNPELLSLVQNLDEKPKGDHHGAGFESGPEEDVLSLGAEACNFMQASGRKFKAPPPVAPKPQQSKASGGLVNGASSAHDISHLKGKGAELFAKRQSRMDKFVVEAAPTPVPKARTPSPTPSLPSSWKYSPNIRAPPPIAYNPLHSPFYPLAASRSQASKAESKVKKAPSQKSGIKAIDFMRHQPYQLKSAMFCFGEVPSSDVQASTRQTAQQSSLSFIPAKQVPVKTAKTYEIRRFSTPAPVSASGSLVPTVLAPRSATTLDEPVWRTEMTSISAPASPGPFQAPFPQYQSSPELNQACRGPSPSRPSSSSSFQVARPRFSAAQTGMQARVWRPGSGHP
ncbi:synaptopodin 2-like protein isoform X2 [Rhineura floridana]|uniref:synaptopodin 2-like protein isoform X2 n=1 Tax=Rhineura floridana TaxID=261503 RepID=UPI002AC87A9A|nr:synaptopodin 2-like protein isoform X2 [Rhineura floridana]XP_061490582.1 synaptopodin 2-like protein isoform X2 [Rhineura floridana]